jgi:hypothetical protein
MSEAAGSLGSHAVREGTTVVLVLPELLGGTPDPSLLRATLGDPSRPVRALLYLHAGSDDLLANILCRFGIPTEILLGPEAKLPSTELFVAQMLPGTSPQDEVDLAFAFSDVLLVAPEAAGNPAVRAAEEMGKPIVRLGQPIPALPSRKLMIDRLDPDHRTWRRSCGRRLFGRIEQGVLELFAFNWLGRKHGGFAESFKRLRKCCGRGWGPSAYFAPDAWTGFAPDRNARDGSSRIAAWFDAFDRSALYGSYIHRDMVWLEYLGAALAVLLAVAGTLAHSIWLGVAELITLLLVAFMVLWARWTSLLDRWTACRLAAEQLRIARMSLPLLVLPPALATADKPPPGGAHDEGNELDFLALMQVKRIVRDHGLPRREPASSPVDAAKWLHLIVADQIGYHHRNHHKLEHAEHRLLILSQLIFLSALVAVVAHFFLHDAPWLILFTAAGPAFAAALHGTGTRLGIVHRTALSAEMERELARIDNGLTGMIDAGPPAANWRDVRRLAAAATETMGRENTSWHGLVRRYRDELP